VKDILLICLMAFIMLIMCCFAISKRGQPKRKRKLRQLKKKIEKLSQAEYRVSNEKYLYVDRSGILKEDFKCRTGC
jgi:hypothetical protein